MENMQAINAAQGVQFQGKRPAVEENKAVTVPEQVKDGDNKMKKALIALGVLGAAGVATAIAIKKGKVHKLSDIKFDKGIATIGEDGKKFSGKIVDKLKSGDKITMIYKDGVIQESVRKGEKNFKKVFENIDGEKIVRTTINGETQTKNLTKMAKEAQERLAKEAQEKAAKEAQERLAKEAQEKLAKEAQEKAAKEAQEKLAKEAAEKRAATIKNQEIFSAVDQTTGKSARESAEAFEEVLDRNDEFFSVVDKTTGKSARKSAEVFEEAERIRNLRNKRMAENIVKSNLVSNTETAEQSAEVFMDAIEKGKLPDAFRIIDKRIR